MDEASRTPAKLEWNLVTNIERDICYLYHECAACGCLKYDLYYGSIYALPYWECLEMDDPHDKELCEFVRDGCLVMIFAMCTEMIEGAGLYIQPYIPQCLAAVSRLKPEHEQTIKLVESVQMALGLAERGVQFSEEFSVASRWIFETYVAGYFRRTADELDEWSRQDHCWGK